MNLDFDEVSERRICYDCIGEKFLSDIVAKSGKRRKCFYCKSALKTISIADLADRLDDAFSTFYERTSENPDGYQSAMLADKELEYEWYRDGSPIFEAIQEAAEIDEDAAKDVQYLLEDKYYCRSAAEIGEETEFDSESNYGFVGVASDIWDEEWYHFERSIKSEIRFFNEFGMTLLKKVFAEIDLLQTHSGSSLIQTVGPGHRLRTFFRARVFQSSAQLQSALQDVGKQLGPPPPNLARHGRMNANGISVFYGSNNPNVAISEVRPPVGSRVAVAKFKIVRKLRLLDLRKLSEIKPRGSIFDKSYADLLSRISFLARLCDKLVIPVMPGDEDSEYLITQAIADYLAADTGLQLDGIIFPSIQIDSNGFNVVLFNKASKVKEMDLPNGTITTAQLEMYDEDGPHPFYQINEAVPSNEASRIAKNRRSTWSQSTISRDTRLSSLEIDKDSIEIHQIQEVSYKTKKNTVKVHRHTQIDYDDIEDI